MSDWTIFSPATVDATKWSTFSPATVHRVRNSYITIPAGGMIQQASKTASYVIQHFLYTATKNFSISRLPAAPAGIKFVPCIRWRTGTATTTTATYRYKLWQNVGELLYVPLYAGEKIAKNFVIEIWMNPGETGVTLASDIVIPISIKYPAVLGSYTDVDDSIPLWDQPYTFPQFPPPPAVPPYPPQWSNPLAFPLNDYWLAN